MKKKFAYKVMLSQFIVIVCLVVAMCTHTFCPTCNNQILTDTLTVYAPAKTVIVKKPVPYFTLVPGPSTTDTINLTDTVIVKEYITNYLSKNYYRDTLLNDSTALIILDDIIEQNKITDRTLYYQDLTPTKIVTVQNNTPNKLKLYAGLNSSLTTTDSIKQLSLGPDIMLAFANTNIRLGYDLFNKNIQASVLFKIGRK